MKYLKKFESETAYNSYISGENVYLPNVSLIEDIHDVRYNPLILIAKAGMVCYYDNTLLKFCSSSEWSTNLGTAIGVVVVPSNHTSDGTARIMAINGVTIDGSTASTDTAMAWGVYGAETPLSNMNKVPTWSNTINGTIGNGDYGYLPSNKGFTGSTDCISGKLQYYDTGGPFIPSPYLADGTQNPDYINTSEATSANCLSDFNGKGNTNVLVGLGTAYTAANACNLYSTEGLSAGNWYLPACGELAYIMPRFNEIQSALYTVGGVQLYDYYGYWSSTEYGSGFARYVNTGGGTVHTYDETNTRYVRAFAAVPVSRLSF